MIKTNSMGTAKPTAVISGWDITEFLMPTAQKVENKTKQKTNPVFLYGRGVRGEI